MRIFEVEKKDGLSPILHANASLSYTTKAEKTEQKTSEKLIETVKSSIQPEDFTVDVYPFKSILATTIWNLNDDVFMPDEVWASRKSASNKPINIDHKKLNIIGHSLDALPYTE